MRAALAILRGGGGGPTSPGRRLPVTMSVSSRKASSSSSSSMVSAASSGSTTPTTMGGEKGQRHHASRKPTSSPSSSSTASGGFFRVAKMYMDALATRPVLTKSLTCFVGGVIGDLLAQQTTGLPFDAARNLRLASFGLLFGGPAGHAWHRVLDSVVVFKGAAGAGAGGRSSSSSLSNPRVVLTKLAADQLLFAPLATALLFVFLKVAEGNPAEAASFCAENWWRTLKANWLLWPAANLVAFAAIPQDLRILYSNAVGVAWCAYVSLSLAASAAAGSSPLPPPPPPLDRLE